MGGKGRCPQFVEPGAAHAQPGCGAGGIKSAIVEVVQDASDKLWRQAVDQLFLFTLTASNNQGSFGNPALSGALPPKPPEFIALGQWAAA